MIKEISNNPFRVLGTHANATKGEIEQCYRSLIDGYKQNQSTESIKEVEDAYHAVTSPERHWFYASFWFARLSDKDEHAIQYVEEEDYESAIDIWESNENYVSIHNLMLCYILMGESQLMYYAKAFQYARRHFLVDRNFAPFVEYVDEGEKVASDAAKVFLDVVFSQTEADKPTLYALLGCTEWMEYVRGKWVDADKADARAEEMRIYVKIAEHAKEKENAEKSRKSLFNWIWWVLLFPIYLFVHHQCQESQKPSHFVPLQETIKNNPRPHPIIDMKDSATFNRVNSGIKNMREKSEGEHKSLRERLNERRKRLNDK